MYTGNTDFRSTNINLSFNTTNLTTLCFSIPIIGDILYEGDEQFLVTFGNLPNEEANAGPIEQACITIVDDDSELVSV